MGQANRGRLRENRSAPLDAWPPTPRHRPLDRSRQRKHPRRGRTSRTTGRCRSPRAALGRARCPHTAQRERAREQEVDHVGAGPWRCQEESRRAGGRRRVPTAWRARGASRRDEKEDAQARLQGRRADVEIVAPRRPAPRARRRDSRGGGGPRARMRQPGAWRRSKQYAGGRRRTLGPSRASRNSGTVRRGRRPRGNVQPVDRYVRPYQPEANHDRDTPAATSISVRRPGRRTRSARAVQPVTT